MRVSLSLHTRVALLSIAIIAALFVLNMRAMVSVAEGTVAGRVDNQLDSQIRILTRSIDKDGRFSATGLSSVSELVAPRDGWGWDVRTAAGHWQRGVAPGRIEYPVPHFHIENGIYSGRGSASSGRGVHVRRLDMILPSGPATIVVMSPRSDIDHELDRIRVEIYKLGAEIVLVLVAVAVLQILVGLYPLRKLVKDVAKVRAGEAAALPERQPSDLQPLASEINALIARNSAGLAAARLHAANLAHAVKTPLASLMLQLEFEEASQETRDLVAHLSERVAHHLHRARSAATAEPTGHRSNAGTVARHVKSTLSLIHRDSPVKITASVAAGCVVAIEEEDLGEMIANLCENAFRYARSKVCIKGTLREDRVLLHIEDDGLGIPEKRQSAALQPGVRLDELGKGYGLGLAIVRELAELYGGSLSLGRSERLGGLRATLDLPR